jgi:hypothetical protein
VVVGESSSRHLPNQPLLVQVVVVGSLDVVVAVAVVVAVVVVISLQPNQPGVWQVLVLVVAVNELDDVVDIMVVVASRHPHHPGVLHVSVRVLEYVVLVLVAVELVVGWVCVPFSNFHK